MRIYTRTGDQGDTGLLGPHRVPKDDIRISAYGDVDELNAQIGSLRAVITDPAVASHLERIQAMLLEMGAELASPPGVARPAGAIRDEDVIALEKAIDAIDATLPPLTQFVVPAGAEAACRAHLARCVCRRAERAVVRLLRAQPSETAILPYLNRLSDLLFVLARWANQQARVGESAWRSRGSGRSSESGGPVPAA